MDAHKPILWGCTQTTARTVSCTFATEESGGRRVSINGVPKKPRSRALSWDYLEAAVSYARKQSQAVGAMHTMYM